MSTDKPETIKQPPPPYGYFPLPYDAAADEINLLEYWRVLMDRKWLIMAITVLATAIALAVALLTAPVFRAEVLLAPVEEESAGGAGALGQLGGLASMVGIGLGGSGGTEQSIAVLKSRAFIDQFVKDNALLPVLFSDAWDAQNNTWKAADPKSIPTLRDAYEAFTGNVFKVATAKDSGLVTLSIEWTDPELAAQWANQLVARLNTHRRQGAVAEAEKSIAYLEEQLRKTSIVEMQQALYRLIEVETKKIMLANVREEFAFRVIDPAVVPEKKVRPKRALIVVLGFLAGSMLGVFAAFFLAFLQRQKDQAAAD